MSSPVAQVLDAQDVPMRPIKLDSPSRANTRPQSRSPVKSPFFVEPAAVSPIKINRLAGTVSSIPFPSLDAPCFSLIQETLCHEPFWLLIAVTFLIKTSGKLAIPVFYAVRERFPTPTHLADPASEPELKEMIQHLGLVSNRTTMMQKYAKGWIENPPTPGVRHRVKGYDKRDADGGLDTGQEASAAEEPDEEWEIGHLTRGKYALDSWRIFCRDELLGRAQDWNGKGAPPEFQPEWMRTRPNDKELRACLRWMWMKEGWEWDPVTGEKSALRPEMAAAVNEHRVEYDDTGGLRILDEPRAA
ncbi:methyl-CpG-binding domain-containing protein 4 [Plectosphaerella plurivora]|uniref:Methyl-CpG-binding domain-containing protein 4 n=1 Tax=Plectosphaerella plurivora TaxID=936078 RepID=A0A9P9ACA4_9PEZI|nr:methyl-CpG-binding domain-containing protein 4 [Plectosphaerella plurivora]